MSNISIENAIRRIAGKNEYELFLGGMEGFEKIKAKLLLTSTPHPSATANWLVQDQLNDFLGKNEIAYVIVDCEPIYVRGNAIVTGRGTYSDKCRAFIEAFTDPGDIVIDPYCGCSFTGEIALKLDRSYIGIDISKDCLEKSQERLQKILNGEPAQDERYIPS